MILKDWSRLSNAHPRCSRAQVKTIYLNPRVSLSGYYVVILSLACSLGVGAQKTDSALPSFARKGRSKKGKTGRETFSDGQVGGAQGRQGKARPERGEKLAEGERAEPLPATLCAVFLFSLMIPKL